VRELWWSGLETCVAHTMRTLIDLGPKLRNKSSAIYLKNEPFGPKPFELSFQYFTQIIDLKKSVRDSDSF
jgi:hypothetical protein